MLDQIMRFENGEMGFDEVVEFVQQLIDTGMAWKLQGSYGRLAVSYIEAGYCHYTQE